MSITSQSGAYLTASRVKQLSWPLFYPCPDIGHECETFTSWRRSAFRAIAASSATARFKKADQSDGSRASTSVLAKFIGDITGRTSVAWRCSEFAGARPKAEVSIQVDLRVRWWRAFALPGLSHGPGFSDLRTGRPVPSYRGSARFFSDTTRRIASASGRET